LVMLKRSLRTCLWAALSRAKSCGSTGRRVRSKVRSSLLAVAVWITGGFTWSPDGRFLDVGSRFTNEILRYDGVIGSFMGVFVSAGGGGLDQPNGVVFGPDGNLYVSSNQTNQVLRYNGTTGAFIDEFVSRQVGALIIGDLMFRPDGTLWVISRNEAGRRSISTTARLARSWPLLHPAGPWIVSLP
jgi:DNA-binding beta-propeller fold protein YncE